MHSEIKKIDTPHGQVTLFTLTNNSGAKVVLSTLGAGIVSVVVPDKDGKLADVALGYENVADFMADGPCAGKTPGRFANRIDFGKFTIDGTTYQVRTVNDEGQYSLHGGPNGFMNRIWEGTLGADNKVTMTYTSADGEEGFPGECKATIVYEWTENNEIKINYSAVTDKPTVVNLTNHIYFNLNGEGNGNILGHSLLVNAQSFLETSKKQVPTGVFTPVEGTPMDFRKAKAIGKEIRADFEPLVIGRGYDHCWVIDGENGKLRHAATLTGDLSGRSVEVYTTQPGMQVYTGNWLEGCPVGKQGHIYGENDGVALECQGLPDAPNHVEFPNSVLRPGEEYKQTIEFHFKK
jgi:aldose 1-epimerase